jgi:hypothetical protein
LNQDLSPDFDPVIFRLYSSASAYFLISGLHLISQSCSLIYGYFVSRWSFFSVWIRLFRQSFVVIAFQIPQGAGQPLMLLGRTLGTWWSLLSQASSGMESKPGKYLAHHHLLHLLIASFRDHL